MTSPRGKSTSAIQVKFSHVFGKNELLLRSPHVLLTNGGQSWDYGTQNRIPALYEAVYILIACPVFYS